MNIFKEMGGTDPKTKKNNHAVADQFVINLLLLKLLGHTDVLARQNVVFLENKKLTKVLQQRKY